MVKRRKWRQGGRICRQCLRGSLPIAPIIDCPWRWRMMMNYSLPTAFACFCWVGLVRGLLRLWRWHVVRRTKKAEAERGQALVQRVYLLYRRNQYVLAPGDETFSKFLCGKKMTFLLSMPLNSATCKVCPSTFSFEREARNRCGQKII